MHQTAIKIMTMNNYDSELGKNVAMAQKFNSRPKCNKT